MTQWEIDELRLYIEEIEGDIQISRLLGENSIADSLIPALELAKKDLAECLPK